MPQRINWTLVQATGRGQRVFCGEFIAGALTFKLYLMSGVDFARVRGTRIHKMGKFAGANAHFVNFP
jgi:hypothetical protein